MFLTRLTDVNSSLIKICVKLVD